MGESQGTAPTPSQAGEVGLGVHPELRGTWEAALLCTLCHGPLGSRLGSEAKADTCTTTLASRVRITENIY